MNRPRLEVPRELTNLLLDFTVNVLIEKPTDIKKYAADYFAKLKDQSETKKEAPLKEDTLSDEDDDFEPPPVRKAVSRRKSVFAEQYNPEDDADDEEKIIYPKSDEQRQHLAEAVKNILLFRSLDQAQMQEVIDAMFEKKVETGDVIIKQYDDGDYFYVISSGKYNIFVDVEGQDKLVGQYCDVGSFGELALMYNMPRAATIVANSPGSLWVMDRSTFRRIVLKSAFARRKQYESLLEKVPMLQTLEPYERMNLCDALVPKSFSDGDTIIREGDAGDGMFFIQEGVVRITMLKKNDAGQQEEKEITTLSKGDYFGELALVTQKPRAASATAKGDVQLAFLDVAAFERLLGPCMDIMGRNVDTYRQQLVELFGSEANVSDLR